MAFWSSIRDKAHAFYQRWKAEIQIYGIGLLLTFSGLATGRDKAAGIVFGIMILYDLMRRFGEPYRALGEQEFARRQQARQQWWREQTEDLLGRFIVQPPPPPPATTAPTRLIPAPLGTEEDLPESPSSPLPETDSSPTPPPTPVVTHPT
jgi:hypothetical protein